MHIIILEPIPSIPGPPARAVFIQDHSNACIRTASVHLNNMIIDSMRTIIRISEEELRHLIRLRVATSGPMRQEYESYSLKESLGLASGAGIGWEWSRVARICPFCVNFWDH